MSRSGDGDDDLLNMFLAGNSSPDNRPSGAPKSDGTSGGTQNKDKSASAGGGSGRAARGNADAGRPGTAAPAGQSAAGSVNAENTITTSSAPSDGANPGAGAARVQTTASTNAMDAQAEERRKQR